MKKILLVILFISPLIYFLKDNKKTLPVGAIQEASNNVQITSLTPTSEEKVLPTSIQNEEPQKKKVQQKIPEGQNIKDYFYKNRNEMIPFVVENGKAIIYGDVMLGEVESDFKENRGVIDIPTFNLWETSKIYYAIDKSVYNEEAIKKAIEYFNEKSSVKFIPYDGTSNDAIFFTKGDKHCYSFLGKIGGLQPIYLSKECGVQEILHEMMHALGFFHEQSRTDRDEFVEILWDNIEEEYSFNFSYVPDQLMYVLSDTPFDYHSVMLYDERAFAKKGKIAMRSKRKDDVILPVAEGLSESDLERIYYLYQGK